MKKRTMFFALFAFLLSGTFLFGMDGRLDEKRSKDIVKLGGEPIRMIFGYINDGRDIVSLALTNSDYYSFFIMFTKNRPLAYDVPFPMVEGKDETIYNSFHKIGASAKEIIKKKRFQDIGELYVDFDVSQIYLPNNKLAEVFDEKNNITKCLKSVSLTVDLGWELLLDRLKACCFLESIDLNGGCNDLEEFPDLEVCYVSELTEAIQDFPELRSLALWFNSYNFDGACECERITELSMIHVTEFNLNNLLNLFPNIETLDVRLFYYTGQNISKLPRHEKVKQLDVNFEANHGHIEKIIITSRMVKDFLSWFPNLEELRIRALWKIDDKEICIGSEFIATHRFLKVLFIRRLKFDDCCLRQIILGGRFPKLEKVVFDNQGKRIESDTWKEIKKTGTIFKVSNLVVDSEVFKSICAMAKRRGRKVHYYNNELGRGNEDPDMHRDYFIRYFVWQKKGLGFKYY